MIIWVQDLYGTGLRETARGPAWASKFLGRVESGILRLASAVVVIHDRFAQVLHSSNRASKMRIATVRNWTHLEYEDVADPVDIREQFGWPANEIIVLHAGNMGIKQGLHGVVEAGRLAEQRELNIRFLLVGDGAMRDGLQELIDEEPSKVEILAPLDKALFMQSLRAADVLLVHESPGVSEMAVPSKLTSYFSAGRPVLAATDPHGITAQEVRAAEAGVVVEAGDPEGLLDAVIALMSDPLKASRLGRNGVEYCKTKLSQEAAIDAFEDIIEDLSSPTRPT